MGVSIVLECLFHEPKSPQRCVRQTTPPGDDLAFEARIWNHRVQDSGARNRNVLARARRLCRELTMLSLLEGGRVGDRFTATPE